MEMFSSWTSRTASISNSLRSPGLWRGRFMIAGCKALMLVVGVSVLMLTIVVVRRAAVRWSDAVDMADVMGEGLGGVVVSMA